MNSNQSRLWMVLKSHTLLVVIGVAVYLMFCCGLSTAQVTNRENAHASEVRKAPSKTLSGAELYSMHCNRCHPERYPTERTAAQWKTIALHMQVRANIPPSEIKLILKYLQENSGR